VTKPGGAGAGYELKLKKKRVLSFSGIDPLKLFGQREQHLEILEEQFPGRVVVRGDEVILRGSESELRRLTDFFGELFDVAKTGRAVSEKDFRYLLEGGGERRAIPPEEFDKDVVVVTRSGRPIRPKTPHQKAYVEAIAAKDIVFAIGPAGTGKTYLAVAAAVAALKRREIERIFLVRPVVEAGESLGFLPGDFQAKLDPYMRPVIDALYEMVGAERTMKYQESNTVEIAPLAYMRGRTLNNAYVILDEAQNTTKRQMKMFLTRLGNHAKAIVNGDITQIDLDPPSGSGLIEAQKVLADVDGIGFVYMDEEDVIRHRLVRRIISAFSKNGNTE
jgi:phosphate starvation-inducible PhoH-like protein